jgi:hypothetical protein
MQTETPNQTNPNQSINDCLELQKKISKAIIDKDFYAKRLDVKKVENITADLKYLNSEFTKKNCTTEIGKAQKQQLDKIATDYQEIDKIRIETESVRQRNKKVLIGGSILIVGLGLLLSLKKKKN